MILTNRYKIESILLQEKHHHKHVTIRKKEKNLSTRKIYIYIFDIYIFGTIKKQCKKINTLKHKNTP